MCHAGSTKSVPLHRCLALTLYHGCSVFVHLLSAYLLSRRREAHFQHERIKCLTLLVAFVIMMVGPFLGLRLLLSFARLYPVCGPFQEVCSVCCFLGCAPAVLVSANELIRLRTNWFATRFVRNTVLQRIARPADPYLLGLRHMQVGFVLMFVKEQTDLRGAPSVPVPVTAVYLTLLVRIPVALHACHARAHSAWHRHWQTNFIMSVEEDNTTLCWHKEV